MDCLDHIDASLNTELSPLTELWQESRTSALLFIEVLIL